MYFFQATLAFEAFRLFLVVDLALFDKWYPAIQVSYYTTETIHSQGNNVTVESSSGVNGAREKWMTPIFNLVDTVISFYSGVRWRAMSPIEDKDYNWRLLKDKNCNFHESLH